MNGEEESFDDGNSADTAPGVRLIKKVWNIKTTKPPREKPPEQVVHDIYHLPSRKNEVPPRHHGVARH